MPKRKIRKTPTLNDAWRNYILKTYATYCSYVTEAGQNYIKVIVMNELGGKDTVLFKALGEMRSQEWEYIVKVLKTKSYESKGDVSIIPVEAGA